MPPKLFEEETKEFVEKAYTFPTGVEAKQGNSSAFGVKASAEATPEGLMLRIAPEYVPAAGTLMVDANAEILNDRGQPIAGSRALIQCAVHFINTDGGGFRYCVMPEGVPLRTDASVGDAFDGESISDWAWSTRVRTSLGGGAAQSWEVLEVFVGRWAVHEEPDERAARAVSTAVRLPALERFEAEAPRRVERRALLAERATPGLGGVLESGRFQVTGTVAFAPLRPLNAQPQAQQYDGEVQPVAEEAVDFRYAEGRGVNGHDEARSPRR